MPDERMIKYATAARDQGFDREFVFKNLQEAGWPQGDIEKTVELVFSSDIPENPPIPTFQPESTLIQETHEESKIKGFSSKNSHKMMRLSIIFVAGIILLGAVGYGAYTFFLADTPPTFTEIASTFQDQKSVQIKSLLSTEFRDSFTGGTQQVEAAYTTQLAFGEVKSNQIHQIRIETSGFGNIDVEARVVDEKVYVQIHEVPFLLAMFLPRELAQQWIVFDIKRAADDLAVLQKEGVVGSEIQEDIPEVNDDTRRRVIAQIFKEVLPLSVTYDVTGEEQFEGRTMYRYEFIVDSVTLFEEFLKVLVEEGVIEAREREDMLTSFAEYLEIKNLTAEQLVVNGSLLVGTRDSLPYRLSLDLSSILSSQDPESALYVEQVDFLIEFSEYGAGFEIEVPEGARTLSEIFEDANQETTIEPDLLDPFSATLNARRRGQDAATKSRLNNARAQAELFYDQNGGYAGVCTDTSSFSIMSTIEQLREASEEVDCVDGANFWRAYAALSFGYYCVDSTGWARELDQTPQGQVCE